MVEVRFQLLLLVFLAVVLMPLLAGWIHGESRWGRQRGGREESSLLRCSICTYVYVDDMRDELPRCPRCGTYERRGEGPS